MTSSESEINDAFLFKTAFKSDIFTEAIWVWLRKRYAASLCLLIKCG